MESLVKWLGGREELGIRSVQLSYTRGAVNGSGGGKKEWALPGMQKSENWVGRSEFSEDVGLRLP
jgi:hypothetical protein